jgi:hypothetical protein
MGGFGLNLKTLDLAKFGQLYLQRGMWNGQQILSEAWIAEATKAQISNGDNPDNDWHQGYGSQFWRSRHNSYRADGAFGQFCIVMPDQQAILAMTSGTSDMGNILNAVWEHILPGMYADILPENVPASQELNKRLAHLAIPLPQTLSDEPSMATRVSKRTIKLEPNKLHTTEIMLTFEKDASTVTLRDDKDVQHIIAYGKTDWIVSKTLYGKKDEEQLVAAHAGWRDDHTFAISLQYIETPFCLSYTLGFSTDTLEVSIKSELSFSEELSEQFHGQLV